MAKLVYIEGVGEVYAQKLSAAGVDSTDELLKLGATPKGRKMIAEKSGISETLILEWVNHVDLFRIKGIGQEYADLLEEVGVDTIPELAQRRPDRLVKKMGEVNKAKKLVRRLPVLSQVKNWINQAKMLSPQIETGFHSPGHRSGSPLGLPGRSIQHIDTAQERLPGDPTTSAPPPKPPKSRRK